MPARSGRSAASTARRATGLLAGFLAVSVGAGALVAGVAAPAVFAAGSASNDTVEAFNALPAALDQPALSQQTRILYSDGSLMATFYYENRISVPLTQVSPTMQQAIVAIEDSRFYEHGGVDPRGLTRAFVSNVGGSDVQGASTLTQQWIKNVQVEEALAALPLNATTAQRQAAFSDATVRSGLDGYARKLREMKLAIAVEKKLSKDQILENYLNIANFSGGQYGVEAASRHWFDKDAKDLDLADAALLAGLVQNPVGYDPSNQPAAAQARRDVVLGRMLELGVIDQAAHDAAVATPLADQLDVQPTPNGCDQAGDAGFFCDYAVDQFRTDDAFGGTQEERTKELYRGGLTITTTLDRGQQEAAVAAVRDGVPVDSTVRTSKLNNRGEYVRAEGTSNIGASSVSVVPGDGAITTMAENRAYSSSPQAPAGSTAINYNVDLDEGGSSGFQPGSNFKPFVLATWLASGKTLNQTVDGTKRDYPNGSWKYDSCPVKTNGFQGGDGGAPYSPGNAGDGEESAQMSVLQATYDSVNTGYAAIENQLELCDIAATAGGLGVHKASADTNNLQGTKSTDLNVTPSMMLGTDVVSPLTIATAYAAFAADGTYCAPRSITKVTGVDGQEQQVPDKQCRQAIPTEVAQGVNYALQRVMTQGTAAQIGGLAGGRESAGKTGTTDNAVATWFTGYTPQLATAVWIGVPEQSMPLDGARIAGRTYPKMYGATVAAPIWKRFMDSALAGQPETGFSDPPQSVIGYAAPIASSSPSATGGSQRRYTPAPRTQAPQPPATAPSGGSQGGGDAGGTAGTGGGDAGTGGGGDAGAGGGDAGAGAGGGGDTATGGPTTG